MDRDILLVPAENPDEDPAFNEIRQDLPPSEEEFTSLWKLYLCSVAAVRARDAGVKNEHLSEVLDYLGELKIVHLDISLNRIIKSISEYVKRVFRPREIEGTALIDPTTGAIRGFSGRISFSEPTTDARDKGVRPIREILAQLNLALAQSGQTLWLLLDRLDVAFAGNDDIEARALRALFGAYKDMGKLDRLRMKLFIRSDIWDRIVRPGLREATHAASPERTVTLKWDNELLFSVFVKRLLRSDLLCNVYGIDRSEVLGDASLQREFVDRIFPDKVDTGRNPKTFDWICGRIEDGKNQVTPRELIQFCSALRSEQLERLEKSAAPPPDELLFERASFKAALVPVSANRLKNTIYAEYAVMTPWIEALKEQRSLQSIATLSSLWHVNEKECSSRAEELEKIGLFRRAGSSYEIPILYRSALKIVREPRSTTVPSDITVRMSTKTKVIWRMY